LVKSAGLEGRREPGGQRRFASITTLALSAVLLVGCDLFERDRKPYTPFPVASGRPEPLASASASAALPAPSVVPPRARSVYQAPARATRWQLAGRELEAPAGLLFKLALVGTLESGNPNDVVAWLVDQPEGGRIGELWLFPNEGAPKRLAAPPSVVPTGPACQHTVELEATGKNSVTLDVSATCTTPLLPRAPTRSLSVVAPLAEQPLILEFQAAPAVLGERLELEINSDDRDGDARDDVELVVVLEAAGGPAAEARFAWLDRATGPAQDAAEPAKSFREIGTVEVARAKEAGASADAIAHVNNARRLFAAICAEGGVPRLFDHTGAPLACGDLKPAFDAFAEANMVAALSQRDIALAFGEFERASWYPGSGERSAFGAAWLKRLRREVSARRVIKLVPLKAQPLSPGNAPRFSPLSFHADGSLLMLTLDGLVRAAPDGRYEYEASAEIDPWPTVVVSPWGDRLVGVEFPCERAEVAWLTSSAEGAPRPPSATGVLAPRPGRCANAATFSTPAITPAAWTKAGLSAFIGAIPVGPRGAEPIPMGSATSPNGQHTIVVTRWGLLVTGAGKPALWTFDDDALAPQLSECVVSNNAQAAACLLQGRAYVILPDPKSG
jgi:hypothetical protein